MLPTSNTTWADCPGCLLIFSFREIANQLKVLFLAVGEDRSTAIRSQRQVVAFLAWCLLKPAPTSPLILWHQQRTKPFSWLFVNSLHLSSCAPLILKKADIVMQSGSCYLSCRMKENKYSCTSVLYLGHRTLTMPSRSRLITHLSSWTCSATLSFVSFLWVPVLFCIRQVSDALPARHRKSRLRLK